MAILPLPPCDIYRHFSNPTSFSSYGHLRLASPLFRTCCRRITRPSLAARAELETSSPTKATMTTASTSILTHRVTVHDRQRGVVHEFLVPEDQYILHTAESQNISLPFACRHGCCTSCAVRIKSGQIRQPEALGISAELKDKEHCICFIHGNEFYVGKNLSHLFGIYSIKTRKWPSIFVLRIFARTRRWYIGKDVIEELFTTHLEIELGYALLCVGFPSSDVVVETQDEDEVYWLQFGRYFARGPIERDDYALELAMGDE